MKLGKGVVVVVKAFEWMQSFQAFFCVKLVDVLVILNLCKNMETAKKACEDNFHVGCLLL